jgi:hypothetical protein
LPIEVHLFEAVIIGARRGFFVRVLVIVFHLAIACAGDSGKVEENSGVGAVLDEKVSVLGFGSGMPGEKNF